MGGARRLGGPLVRRWGRPTDLCCVVAPQNRGWILDAISRELAARVDGRAVIHDSKGPLPSARAYFFSHYLLFLAHREEPAVRRATTIVYYTHPSYQPADEPRVVSALAEASNVISLSSTHGISLVEAGLPRDRLSVILPGADPTRFRPHERTGGAIGFCSAYYERKRPEIIAGLVHALPKRRFRLLGRGWDEAPGFEDLLSAPNFEYLEAAYDQYPAFYDSIDVLVSPSRLEGGPIPLIEAMMANVVPVASRTGFAPDLIEHGVNGYLCDVDADVEAVARMVALADRLDTDVRASVEHLDWDRFALQVLDLANVRGQRSKT